MTNLHAQAYLSSAASVYEFAIVALAIMILIPSVFSLMMLSCILAQATEDEDDAAGFTVTSLSAAEWLALRNAPSPLDADILRSIPLVKFMRNPSQGSSLSSRTTMRKVSSCVVCLSPFEANETLKLLPPCRHAFHPACIDPWFETHSTCPICRSEVSPSHPASASGMEADSIDIQNRTEALELVVS
ncbi:hypothetical protein KP509_25G031000 [Ceratopteris richardii]|uniref:RING-type domain-containing protein n=1 Tax=Ceratopteris richardii TaxID=49495 RepID=A0A8T2RQ11_CERRI|nr:hypothetical protein KP509_25G031000 [Ceratopteris richardii]